MRFFFSIDDGTVYRHLENHQKNGLDKFLGNNHFGYFGKLDAAQTINPKKVLKEHLYETCQEICESVEKQFSIKYTAERMCDTRGIIVYNFVAENRCSKAEIVNKKASNSTPQTYSFCVINGKVINLPKPEYPQIAKAVKAAGEVQVQVIIDKKGRVIKAKVVSGHPFLRANSIKAALKSTFEPVKLSGKPVKITGVIVYKFLL